MENERGRQEQLARERIAARKKRLEEARNNRDGKKEDSSEADKLEEEKTQDQADDLSNIEQLQREGTCHYFPLKIPYH